MSDCASGVAPSLVRDCHECHCERDPTPTRYDTALHCTREMTLTGVIYSIDVNLNTCIYRDRARVVVTTAAPSCMLGIPSSSTVEVSAVPSTHAVQASAPTKHYTADQRSTGRSVWGVIALDRIVDRTASYCSHRIDSTNPGTQWLVRRSLVNCYIVCLVASLRSS